MADDGARHLDPRVCAARRASEGLATADELEAMDDRESSTSSSGPGFSTAEGVSDVSGRGVGMDVVRETIVHR